MKRTVMSTYYHGKQPVKTTRAAYVNSAVQNAVGHMLLNEYNATVVEVFNMVTGKLYAVLRNSLHEGKLKMIVDFKDDIVGRIDHGK